MRAAEVESIARGTGLLCQLARVTLEYEPGAPVGPRTLVAKLAAEDPDVRGYDFAQCVLDYRRSILFAFVYPVIGGGLGDLANERGHALARVMAERSAAAILDWSAADLLPA